MAGEVKPPLPLPSLMLTLSERILAVTKSWLLSPLKSPTATETGPELLGRVTCGGVGEVKPPLPLPSLTLTLLEAPPLVTKSSLPSPLKSPTATE